MLLLVLLLLLLFSCLEFRTGLKDVVMNNDEVVVIFVVTKMRSGLGPDANAKKLIRLLRTLRFGVRRWQSED